MPMTRVDAMILAEVDRGGRVRSLFALTVDLCVDYRNAHKRVTLLEAAGLLRVERDARGRGQPLVLSRPANVVRQLSFSVPSQTCDGTSRGRYAKR